MRRALLPALCLTALCLGSSEDLECPQPAASYYSAPAGAPAGAAPPRAAPPARAATCPERQEQENDDIHFIQVRAPRPQAVQRRSGVAEGAADAALAAAAPAPPVEEPARGPPPSFVQVGEVESENRSAAELPRGEDIEAGDDFGGAASEEDLLVGAVREAGPAGAASEEDLLVGAVRESGAAGGRDGGEAFAVPVPENAGGAAAAVAGQAAGGAAAAPPLDGGGGGPPLAAATEGVAPEEPEPLQAAPAAAAAAAHALPDGADAAQADLLARNLLLGLLVLCTGSALLATLVQSGRASATPLRQQVEQLQQTTGAELRSMFGLDGAESGQAVSPGILTRLHGHVVAKPGGILTAPFSGRQCVSYSASVSSQRTDGVHQPPVAFHEAGVDFAVRLDDDSGVTMSVHRHEASVFDMVAGKFAREHAFADAPDGWRGFTMAHVGAGAALGAGGATGGLAAGAALEFCECALLVGSRVTCVGEVVRNNDGTLSLCPWRPAALPRPPPGGSRGPLGKAVPWLAPSWERGPLRRAAATGGPPPSPLAGRVLVSDDPELSRQGGA